MAQQIPREFIQLLLSRTDIVDLIDGRVPLRKKSSNNYFACCPFHNEKSASFSVSQNKQFYYCFGCGAHGNAIDFLMNFDRLNFPEAIEALAKHVGVEVPRESVSYVKPAVNNDNYDLLANVSKYYQTQLKQAEHAIEYLKKRGISGLIAKEFGIGFAPPGWDHVLQQFSNLKSQLFETGMLIKKDDGGFYDRFRERIMFPILNRRGQVIGFGGRVIDKGEPKYLNSPETPLFQKGHELYGLYQALEKNRTLQRVVIVEGYMDVIALFQNDVTYAVATLGTATTAHHLQRLFRHTSEIIFCFDGDQAGRTAAWRALLVTLPLMRDDIQVNFMFLPDGEDPDTLIRKEGKAEFEKRMQDAMPLSGFFFQAIAAQADLGSMDGRARFVKLAAEHLKEMPEGFFQEMMLEELAKKARLNNADQLKQPKNSIQKPAAKPLKARTPSAIRLAITLLVQQPSLSRLATDSLPNIDTPGLPLLRELIENINKNDLPSTGALLEHWRDREESNLLAKLAQTEHMIPETGVEKEFLGTIQLINKSAKEQVIQQLLAKASQQNLAQEEKQKLHELIATKN